jgi:hypothetical protein
LAANFIKRFDYLAQKKFLSFPTPFENEELINNLFAYYDKYNEKFNLILEQHIEETIINKFGTSYRLNVDNEMKNIILFPFYLMFSPLNFDKQIRDFLFYLIVLKKPELQTKLIDLLLPYEKCMVYTILKTMDEPDLNEIISIFKNYNIHTIKFNFNYEKINKDILEFKMKLMNEDKYNMFNSISKDKNRFNQVIKFRLMYDMMFDEIYKIKSPKDALDLLED